MSEIERILAFWLEEIGPKGWYERDDAVDAKIVRDYAGVWHDAMAGRLHGWQEDARGTLALLVLTDQFPRNMFRGTAGAFASDAMARRAAKQAIGRGLSDNVKNGRIQVNQACGFIK